MRHLDDSGLYWWSEKTETVPSVPVKLAMEVGGGAGLARVVATAVALCSGLRLRLAASVIQGPWLTVEALGVAFHWTGHYLRRVNAFAA